MDFGLNEEQEMMQTLAKDFLAAEYPDKVLKAMVKDEKGYTPELWKKMQEMNLMGLSLPEQYGGVGDFLDLIIVLEEMAKACFLSPYFSTVALAAGALMAAGNEEQKKRYLSAIAEGKKIFTLALTEEKAEYTPEAVKVSAQEDLGDYIINGIKLFVPDAQSADYIICAARTSTARDGITLFIVDAANPGLVIKPIETIGGDKQAKVTFNNVKVFGNNILGEVNKGWVHIEKVLERANVARCAEMVGLSEKALQLTLDYAKERIAYGHPIGAFQAVQHRFVDMLAGINTSKYLMFQAAWKINSGLPAAKEVAMAKAWAAQSCRNVMTSAHQIHGAIAFTEDHILHYYTKRVRDYEFSFGGSDEQFEKLAGLYK